VLEGEGVMPQVEVSVDEVEFDVDKVVAALRLPKVRRQTNCAACWEFVGKDVVDFEFEVANQHRKFDVCESPTAFDVQARVGSNHQFLKPFLLDNVERQVTLHDGVHDAHVALHLRVAFFWPFRKVPHVDVLQHQLIAFPCVVVPVTIGLCFGTPVRSFLWQSNAKAVFF
jgi:hypothetical protein